jgi:hypothetical protein
MARFFLFINLFSYTLNGQWKSMEMEIGITQVICGKTGGTRLSRPAEWQDEYEVGPHSLCGRWAPE